jgi:WD40 repeat protein
MTRRTRSRTELDIRFHPGGDDPTLDQLKGNSEKMRAGCAESRIAFHPSGEILAAAIMMPNGREGVFLWDMNGNDAGHVGDFNLGLTSFGFTPEGDEILTASNVLGRLNLVSELTLWDLSGHESPRRAFCQAGVVNAIAFDPEGDRFVIASNDNRLGVWDRSPCRELFTLRGHT